MTLSNNFIRGQLLILQKNLSCDTYMQIVFLAHLLSSLTALTGVFMTDFSELTHADINWDQLWRTARKKKGWSSKGAGEWDKKASSFASRNKTSPYIELLLSHLPLTADMTVLDVGCGPGTLSLPLAGRARSVTALDFSEKMLEILVHEAKELQLDNITAIRCAWEDDWQEKGIAIHDIAIASRSLSVDDISAALTKLDAFAAKYVFIADRISPTPFDPEVFKAVGRPFVSGPDYIYTLNILYTMGIHPNVTILEPENQFHYQDLEQAFLTYSWMLKDLTAAEENTLKFYLQHKALPTADGQIAIPRQTPPRWALIWWAKEHSTGAAHSCPQNITDTPHELL